MELSCKTAMRQPQTLKIWEFTRILIKYCFVAVSRITYKPKCDITNKKFKFDMTGCWLLFNCYNEISKTTQSKYIQSHYYKIGFNKRKTTSHVVRLLKLKFKLKNYVRDARVTLKPSKIPSKPTNVKN